MDFKVKQLVPNKTPAETTVVVAMSGGVDSSCVAALLKNAGYNCIGITLQLWDYTPASEGGKKAGTCCALDDVYDARRVCQDIGIPHYVLNYESEFQEKVVDDFVDTYLQGATPIPCVRCNQRIKFDSLLDKAKALGADVLVTGHYIRKDKLENGKAVLKTGLDPIKDQSYFLFTTTQEQLEFADFPLGELSKEETRELAKSLGLHIHNKKDSQDICFVPGGNYRDVVTKFAPEAAEEGDFINSKGEVLGKHPGIINFTVGQRKGLGIALGEPMYVIAIDKDTKSVVLGTKDELGTTTFHVDDLNWIGEGEIKDREVRVKVRSTHEGGLARITDMGNGRLEVEMYEPEAFVAPGQAAVFYEDNRMLGGGWIRTKRHEAAERFGEKVKIQIA